MVDKLKTLENDIVHLNEVYRLYEALFTDDKNVFVLSSINDYSFGIVQSSLQSTLFSQLSRLADEPKVESKNGDFLYNLSIDLIRDIAKEDKLRSAKKVSKLIHKFKETFREKELSLIRNKFISHRDIDYAIGKKAVQDIFIADIKILIDQINEILNCYYLEKCSKQKDFSDPRSNHIRLMDFLKNGDFLESVMKRNSKLRHEVLQYRATFIEEQERIKKTKKEFELKHRKKSNNH